MTNDNKSNVMHHRDFSIDLLICMLIMYICHTYKLANPALLTAVEMALMAVSRELSSSVRLPVAFGIFICSFKTKRVSVIEFVSISPPLAIAPLSSQLPGMRSRDYGAQETRASGA